MMTNPWKKICLLVEELMMTIRLEEETVDSDRSIEKETVASDKSVKEEIVASDKSIEEETTASGGADKRG